MRRTVGWSSMTRILGALRTSGSVTVAARRCIQSHSPDFGVLPDRSAEVPEYYSGWGVAVIVMWITLGFGLLLRLGSTLPAILETGAALIVLGAGARESAELEMALVQDAVTMTLCLVASPQTQ